MTDLADARAAERSGPAPGAGPTGEHEPRPAEPPGGVPLPRLVALAGLTPAQALEIGATVLADAALRSATGAGAGGDQVVVVVAADGRAVLGAAPVESVLATVSGAARLRTGRADPAADPVLAALDRAAAELPEAGVPAAARTLQEAAGRIDRAAVRAELAALVRVIGGEARPSGGRQPAEAPGGTPVGRTGREHRTAARRTGAWLLSIVVLAAVVLGEVALLRDDIATDIDLLLDAGRSGAEASTAPEPDGLPVVPPAPAAAGSVAAVDLRPLARCAPGAACTVRLLVRLTPGVEQQVVTWSYRVVDRCTGATEAVPGGSVTVPAGGDRAEAVSTVALPDLPAVAVVAVTEGPAAAASSPVLAGSCHPDRPAP
ncbi:hypothetical protein ACI782_11915 [Geodermatophilus sp. SYSU D00703]